MRNTEYLVRSILTYYTKKVCPYCGSKKNNVVGRKFLVTTLNQCEECNLLFRHPMDTVKFNRKFYQEEYEQADGITTSLPSGAELKKMTENNFVGSGKDYSQTINKLKDLVKGPVRIIDYGANWGYTSYQFLKAGFEVQSYEISKPRAGFGKNMGLEIFTDEKELKGK